VAADEGAIEHTQARWRRRGWHQLTLFDGGLATIDTVMVYSKKAPRVTPKGGAMPTTTAPRRPPTPPPVPPVEHRRGGPAVPLTVRLPYDVYEIAKQAADNDHRTINNWIVQACRKQAELELSS